MPLKHPTETFLVFLLAVTIVVTGFLTSTLHDVPDGGLPWAVLFVLACAYPLSLGGLFRRNRADHAFRILHWFPAVILVVWMVFQLALQVSDTVRRAAELYTWGWGLGVVIVGIILVAWFCLSVIRRRVSRLALLALALVPFAGAAIASETQQYHWEKQVASILWENDFVSYLQTGVSGTGTEIIAMNDEQDRDEPKNLDESEDPDEEAWRERLRAFERRRQRIAERVEEEDVPMIAQTPVPVVQETGTGMEYREVETTPVQLPSAGFPLSSVGLTMMGCYCGVLHNRARRRV